MQIQSVQSGQTVYQTNNAGPSGRRCAGSVDRTVGSDTVSFSDEAMRRAGEEQKGKHADAAVAEPEMKEEDLPLEAYKLPEWAESWCSPLSEVAAELGSKSSWSDSRRDTLTSREERELEEYNEIVHEYFTKGLKDNGITTPVQYYQDLLLNPEKSEKVHEEVRAMLENDERALALMKKYHASLD